MNLSDLFLIGRRERDWLAPISERGSYWKVCFMPFVFTSDLKMVVDLALERKKVVEKNEQRKQQEKAKTKIKEVTKERIHKSTINNYHKRLV